MSTFHQINQWKLGKGESYPPLHYHNGRSDFRMRVLAAREREREGSSKGGLTRRGKTKKIEKMALCVA